MPFGGFELEQRVGLVLARSDERGDLYVKVRVVLPTDLTEEAKQAAERFLELVED